MKALVTDRESGRMAWCGRCEFWKGTLRF